MCSILGMRRPVQVTATVDVSSSSWFTKLLAVTFAVCIVIVRGLPVTVIPKESVSNSAVSKAIDFLTKFGYLPPTQHGTENLRTENQLRSAIRTMQKFGNLEQTGVVDDLTLQLMKRPRCGVPDVLNGETRRTKRYAVQGQKWSSTNITWSVQSGESKANVKMVRAQLQRAFHVWSEASALNFSEVMDPSRTGRADIVVSFLKGPHGDGYPFDGEGSVLAHAFFPGEGIGGDAHFDAEERWMSAKKKSGEEGLNFLAVAAHEIGHSLGLSHSSAPGALMFPYYQAMGEDFQLPYDDADGIRYLYGKKETQKKATVHSLPSTTTSTTVMATSSSVSTTTSITPTDKLPKEVTTEIPVGSTTEVSYVPNICNTSIDAISVIRGEIFAFKEKYFWRLDTNRTLRIGYPVPVHRFWYKFPQDVVKIDALYERSTDTKIVFFAGKRYWLFSANEQEPGYPRPLTDLGLPANLDHIDAAMVWGYNGKTYLFSGPEYWKFDEIEGKVELDYPRSTSAWRGIPFVIDAAFTWNDGNTYFFKGTKFWKFRDVKMKIEKPSFDIGEFWFKCAETSWEDSEDHNITQVRVVESSESDNSASSITFLSWLCILITLVLHRVAR